MCVWVCGCTRYASADDDRRKLAASSLVPVSPDATFSSPTIDVTIDVYDDDDGSSSGVGGSHTPRPSGVAEVYRVVPAGHVWLEGDNPRLSLDSRSYGPLPTRNLRGVAVARVRWARASPCAVASALQRVLQTETTMRAH